MKKYELTDETKELDGVVLHRIRALRDFGDVKAGELGGWLGSENNLSHEGDCWVYGNGRVFGNGWVSDNGRVSDNGWVYGRGWVSGNGHVSGNGWVSDNGRVSDNGWVSGNGWVSDNGEVLGNGHVSDNGKVFGKGWVSGNGKVSDNGRVSGNGHVSGNGWVRSCSDFAEVDGFGRDKGSTSFFRCADGKIRTQCGCFYGDLDEFRAKVRKTHGDSKMAREYLMIADLMEMHFKEDK